MEEPRGTAATNGVNEQKGRRPEDYTLGGVLHSLIATIFYPDHESSAAAASFLQRVNNSISENAPLLREATRNTGRSVLLWTRRGSPLRALLVISVGTISLLALTGILVFMLFFLAATVNAVVISLLVSLAAVGGFLAIFFTCITAIYIGALSIAAFVISVATISAIVACSIAAGWIGFFCVLWLATKKCVDLAKQSLNMTSSVISTYSSKNARYLHVAAKVD